MAKIACKSTSLVQKIACKSTSLVQKSLSATYKK